MERLDLLPPGATPSASAYLATLKEGASQRAMRRALAKVAVLVARFPTKNGRPLGGYERVALDRVPWGSLAAERCAALRDELGQRYKPATVRQCLCAVRGVLRFTGALDAEQIEATRVAVPKRAPRPFAPTGHARDDALCALRSLGLTTPTIVALDVSAWRVGGTRLRVRGRSVRVPDALGDVLDRWVERRGTERGPLIMSMRRGGRLIGRLSPQAAQKRLAVTRS